MIISSSATRGSDVEVIRTHIVTRKYEGVFCRQTSALEYGVFHKAYFTYLSPSVPCGLYISIRTYSICRRRRTCLSVVHLLGRGGGVNTPSQVARYLVAGVLTGVGYWELVYTSDGTVMFSWIMFGETIGQVVLSSCPINQILSLSHPVAYPIESHVNWSLFSLSDIVVHKAVAGCDVCDY